VLIVTLATHANDAWEFERAFEAVRNSAIATYPALIAQLQKQHSVASNTGTASSSSTSASTAATAADDLSLLVEAAATFVPFVSEKLYALALFGLKPLIVNAELKAAADDPCDSRVRAKLSDMFRMPTTTDLTEAYGIKVDVARDTMNDATRRFPSSKLAATFQKLSTSDRSAWTPDRIRHWLPTWEQCAEAARSVLRGPARSHEFHRYMSSTAQHDLLTADTMNALSTYLCQRLQVYHPPVIVSQRSNKMSGATARASITVLEVGAGNGRLTHFLRKYVDKATRLHDYHLPAMKFVATDIAPIKCMSSTLWSFLVRYSVCLFYCLSYNC
jgi:hypothetical protein